MIVELNSENFDKALQTHDAVLVDFWAEWCGYCKLMEPIVEGVASKYGPRILVARVNADENFEVSSRYEFRGLPAFIIFSKGQPACSLLGAVPRDRFESWVQACLEAKL